MQTSIHRLSTRSSGDPVAPGRRRLLGLAGLGGLGSLAGLGAAGWAHAHEANSSTTAPVSGPLPQQQRNAPAFLALEPNGHTIELRMTDVSGRHLRFRVLDGLLNRLSAQRPDGSVDTFAFIAKVHPPTGALSLHPVREREVVREGQSRPGLFMDRPISAQAAGSELQKFGLAQLSMGMVATPVDRRFSGTKSGGDGPGQAMTWRCCSFIPCPPFTSGTFCTYGSGCGGDGCGECCT